MAKKKKKKMSYMLKLVSKFIFFIFRKCLKKYLYHIYASDSQPLIHRSRVVHGDNFAASQYIHCI